MFFNRPLLLVSDPEHSAVEARYAALGRTDGGCHLFVVFTMRAVSGGDLLRVISARPMSRREREAYREAERK